MFDYCLRCLLVVVGTNPWGSSNHSNDNDYQSDDTPCEHDLGSVLGDVVLESADDQEDKPCNTGGCAAGVNTAKLLNKTGEEDAQRER